MKLDPLENVPKRGAVLAWALYDLANQSFTLFINTLLFSLFFKDVVVGADRTADGDRLWSLAVGGSMLVVVALSPFVGALADIRGWRKAMLMATGIIAGTLTCALGALPAGAVVVAMLVYIPANIAYQLGENFLASFLPAVSTPRTIGRVSALGWALGYAGALVLIGVALGAALGLGWESAGDWRPLFVFAGIWFLVGIAPAVFALGEPPRSRGEGSAAAAAAKQVVRTIRDASKYAQLTRFLLAFFVYALGVQTVIFFASIVAKEEVFTDPASQLTKLTLFMGMLTVLAGVAALGTARYQDRVGAKTVVAFFLVVWMLSTGAIALARSFGPIPEVLFWILGGGIGLGIGGIGTSSRSMVGRFAPRHKVAEFFGLWGMVYKLSAVVGVMSFGFVKAGLGTHVALWVLTAFFGVGLALLAPVRETAGVRAARRTEREFAKAETLRGGPEVGLF